MGKVTTDVKITSMKGVLLFKEGYKKQEEIKSVELEDVIVDSGATMMCLSKEIIDRLGLDFVKTTKVNTTNGVEERGIYGPAIYEIHGRMARGDVLEFGHPKIKALVGQIPLEQLDFLINPSSNRLIANPEHEGGLILDLLLVCEDYKYQVKE